MIIPLKEATQKQTNKTPRVIKLIFPNSDIPKPRRQTTALTTEPRFTTKQRQKHCVPLGTLFKGGDSQSAGAVRQPACPFIVYTQRSRGLAGPRRPSAARSPSSAELRGPGPGSGMARGPPAHAVPSSPKWLPAPTKPAGPARPPRSRHSPGLNSLQAPTPPP